VNQIRIQILSDLVRIPEPDQDLHEHENQDPDTNEVCSDPQHCLRAVLRISINLNADQDPDSGVASAIRIRIQGGLFNTDP